MVKFKKVEIKNFMSIKDATLELDNQGLILIEGINKTNDSFEANGVGKSTLVSAITYSLYGKTEKGLKADDVINKKEKKNTSVKLYFDIGEDNYIIERYRKDEENKNKVKLFCNGKEITGSTNDVTDKQILDLFGIDFNTYLNAIVYGQGDMPMFSQATDKGKKEILESITKVEVYKKAQEVAKEKVKEVEDKQNKLQNSIQQLEYQIDSVQYKIEYEQNNYKEQLQRLEAIKEENTKKEQQKVEEEKKLKEQLYNLPDYRQVQDTFQYSEQYNKIQLALQKLEEKKKELLDSYNNTKVELSVETTKLNTEQNKLNSLDTSDKCPVCGSQIDNNHKLKEQENIKNTILSINERTDYLKTQEDLYKQAIQQLDAKATQLLEVAKREEEQEKQHDKLVYSTKEYNNSIDYNKKSLEQQLSNLDSKYQQQDLSKLTPTEPNIKQYEDELKEVNITIDKTKDSIIQLENKKQRYKDAVEAFSNKGLRSVVLDFITPFLNEKANEYLQILSGSDIEIEFQTQVKNNKGELKDKFDVVVNNKSGGSTYKSNSAGEQKRIDLAISFAIQDLVMSQNDLQTNIALYDECFDGLDTIGCENVVRLLKDRLKTVSTIFVITHNQSLKPLFEKTITMIKENGEARMEI
ncbi:recombination related nuclease [Staphylococcus phage Twort]|uniref:ORF009 n=2 Tax=Staphylococcus phage Twort (strain DSM 17442 / HER 48) TaxID=2908167 RepID=Q4Z9B6_BPTWO|nr:exonuclease [Staphylococcus phage Twort]AAX92305.1 ORF009 [Staphylococcus phage Twort]QIW89132.1 recombination related nuclease [Staphylococcus phage Twort]